MLGLHLSGGVSVLFLFQNEAADRIRLRDAQRSLRRYKWMYSKCWLNYAMNVSRLKKPFSHWSGYRKGESSVAGVLPLG
jgi:hypothetical protein